MWPRQRGTEFKWGLWRNEKFLYIDLSNIQICMTPRNYISIIYPKHCVLIWRLACTMEICTVYLRHVKMDWKWNKHVDDWWIVKTIQISVLQAPGGRIHRLGTTGLGVNIFTLLWLEIKSIVDFTTDAAIRDTHQYAGNSQKCNHQEEIPTMYSRSHIYMSISISPG